MLGPFNSTGVMMGGPTPKMNFNSSNPAQHKTPKGVVYCGNCDRTPPPGYVPNDPWTGGDENNPWAGTW